MLRKQINLINDFSGGQDTRTPLITMPLTASPNMRNWHTAGIKNRLVKRGGFSKINNSQVPTDNLDTFYPSGYYTYDHTFGDTATNTNVSQGFKCNTSSTVTKVRLWLKKVGAPTGNITVSIETDSSGVPSGTSVSNGDSSNVDVSTLTTSYGWIVFTFSTNPSLTAGTQYHLVVKGTFSVSSSNYVDWGVDSYDVIYPNGTMSHYDGTTWTSEPLYNACFEIYITNGLLGNVGYAMFDFSSKSQLIGVFGTSLYNMNKSSLGTPNGTWNPISATSTWDSYTKLMLHMDGTNGSTTFTDQIGKTVTANGSAQLATAVEKFGTASGNFDGTNSYLSVPNSSDFDVSGGDFTIDFWAYITSQPGAGKAYGLIGKSDSNGRSFIAYYLNTANVYSIVFVYTTDGSTNVIISNNVTISLSTWTHIAFIRYGSTITIYINGVAQGTTGNIGSSNIYTSTAQFEISRDGPVSPDYLAGNIDEFRFSKGIARWTANFTPSSAAYAATSGTLTSSRFWTFADWQSGTALINCDTGLYSFTGASGATASIVSAAPISKFMVIWKNYCLAFGLRGSPNGYQFSALNDYTTWPVANIFNNGFDTNDGDVITGVRLLKGKLYVFKRYSIFRLTLIGTNPTFQIDLIIGTGSPAHYAIKEVDLGGSIGTVLIFPTTDKKLAIFDGYNIQIINENLTEKSNDLFSDSDTPISFSDMNYTYTDLFHAITKTDTSEYILYCVLNTDTTVKYAFVFDWKTGGVYPYDNQIFSSSVYAFSTSKQKILYTAGYTGYMYQMENTNADDGSNINAYWVSGKIKPNSAGIMSKFLHALLYFKQISSASALNINLQYRFDWNVTWSSAIALRYDRNDSFAFGITQEVDVGTIGDMFQIKLQDNSSQLASTFYGMDLYGEVMGVEVEDRAVA